MNSDTKYLLASIVESSQDSIVTIDLDRIITSWNSGAENMYGYKADEVIGKPLAMVMLPVDIQGLVNNVERIVHEITVPIYETVRIHKNGKEADLEILLSPVRNVSGAVVGISTIARDITARKMNEQQKDEFIAVASHELKTPITSIKGYTQVLIRQLKLPGDEKTASLAMKILKQVDRLIGLIGTLLDTTNLAAGEVVLKVERFDLNKLVGEQIEDLNIISDEHNIIFEAAKIKLVQADRKLIGRVINNIISNAIKYSPEGSDIIITSKEINGGAEVSVQDFGVGIPSAQKDRIFDRYFRVQSAATAKASGIGLGLYISAGIIHQHNGEISVDSQEGEGTKFNFTLPYVHTPKKSTTKPLESY